MATPSSTVYRDSAGNLREAYNLPADSGGTAAPTQAEYDTQGGAVPIWLPHTFTYDNSGNLETDTVSDGTFTWVRTFTYTPSGPATDSGWVKQ